MSPTLTHDFRNILTVILAGIESGNLELAKQAVHRAQSILPLSTEEQLCAALRQEGKSQRQIVDALVNCTRH